MTSAGQMIAQDMHSANAEEKECWRGLGIEEGSF